VAVVNDGRCMMCRCGCDVFYAVSCGWTDTRTLLWGIYLIWRLYIPKPGKSTGLLLKTHLLRPTPGFLERKQASGYLFDTC
jgi:hypothetical protein